MNKIILALIILVLALNAKAQEYSLASPDKSIEVKVSFNNNKLNYKVLKNNELLITTSTLALHTNQFSFDTISNIQQVKKSSETTNIEMLWGISKQIKAAFNCLELILNSQLKIQFRAYNSGIAWRFVSNCNKELQVLNEEANFNFNSSSTIYFPETKGYSTPFEANYLPLNLTQITDSKMGLTPLLIKTAKGTSMVISEVNLEKYPGMFVKLNGNSLQAVFPKYPAKEKEQFAGRWRLTNIPQLSKKTVRTTENYMAKRPGSGNFPWRVIIIASQDKELLQNQLVSLLADKNYKNEQYSWVKPGKVVWDWYHRWNLQDVNFNAGINTATYKYMIDFAAENNLEYVNIDDGWCKLHNLKKVNNKLDIKQVLEYANNKQIGIFLWCTWQTLEDDLIANLNYFQSLGVAGLKVDFFDRCDQKVVDFINELATECAKRKLLLNLHGMYKPTGLQITHPNVLNFEGVLGLEYNKFSDKCTPTHNVTIPFVRNVVGPMDYTPGGMRYVDSASFEKSWSNPHVMTTRAQQMAMYVVYHGGLQMLADSPSFFKKDSIAMHYLKNVPVSWDETIAIDGKISAYAVVARRSGSNWYLAGIAGSKSYKKAIQLSFLDDGMYTMTQIEDGTSSGDLKRITKEVSKNDTIQINAKATGGFIVELKLK